LLALFALLLNTVLPLSPITDAAHAAGAGAYQAADAGETIIICTGAGMRVMQIGPDGKPISDKTPGEGFCPLCTTHVSADLPRSIQVEPAHDTGSGRDAIAPVLIDLPHPSIHATPATPRAPPLHI
jgi:hypothetical protein